MTEREAMRNEGDKGCCDMRKTTLACSVGVILESDRLWWLCSASALHQRSSFALHRPSDPLLHEGIISKKVLDAGNIQNQIFPLLTALEHVAALPPLISDPL